MATELQFSDCEKVGILKHLVLALGSSHSFIENRKDSAQHLAPRLISTASYAPGSVDTAMDRTMTSALMELTSNEHETHIPIYVTQL